MVSWITKPFKAIGKAFKSIGKTIMKGFKSIGKFANKMGIFGQVGMMFLTAGIANAAFGAMSTMGQGFMQGLSQSNNVIAKMAYSTMTGVQKVVGAPLKTVSSAFTNVTKGAVQALKDVGGHMTNFVSEKLGGEAIFNTTTDKIWDSLGATASKYSGNIAKDTSAAFGDAGNFLKDAVGKGPIKSNYQTFTPVGAKDPVTKNLAYNTSAREQFTDSILSQRPDSNATILDRINFKDDPMGLRDSPIGNFKSFDDKNLFLDTVDPLTDKITAPNFKALRDPTIGNIDPLLTRAKTGATDSLKSTFSVQGMASPVASTLLSASTAVEPEPDYSLQIQPTRNMFGRNLQAQAATPQQFFNGFLNYPSETFEATNLQPFNYNQWLQNSSNYKSLSYV